MPSVGRQLCHRLIDTAADVRRYAELLDEFKELPTVGFAVELRDLAERMESGIPWILDFEGERRPALPAGDPL